MDRVPAAPMRRLSILCALCLAVPSAAVGRGAPQRVLLGSSGVGRVVTTVPSGRVEAVRVRAATSGVLRSLDLYLAAREPARRILVGVYSGRSGSLLTSGALVRPRGRGWYSVAVHATPIVAHRTYWLAALAVSGQLRVRAGSGRGCGSELARLRRLSRLPRHWSSGARSGRCLLAIFGAATAPSRTPPGSGSSPPPGSAPADILAPTIFGLPVQGNTLTAGPGVWTGAPTAYLYRWQDCAATCTDIPGATGSSYTLRSSDVGAAVAVVVTATNDFGSASATSGRTLTVTGGGTRGLHVVAGDLINASGGVVRLRGVVRSGTEYMCSEGYGIFDGPTGSAEFQPMTSWNIDTVFMGLNEDCWLGINGVKSAYAGQHYIAAIRSEVAVAEAHGIYPVIGFFWGDPGTQVPTGNDPNGGGQPPLPDNSHAPLFWEEVAETFKNDPNVVFRLQEEPHPSASGAKGAGASTGGGFGSSIYQWQCWAKGSVQYSPSSDSATWGVAPTPTSSNHNCDEYATNGSTLYQTVGMQSLINIIRGTGATNIIQVPGLAYANMLACSPTQSPGVCGFLDTSVAVHDTLTPAQLMADVDVYPDANQVCSTTSCYDATLAPVAAQMPLDAGEVGPNGHTDTKTKQFLSWMQAHNGNYYAWVWDTWGSLITNYNGTAASPWGTDFRQYLP